MKIKTGQHFYGQDIGVLVFSTVTPRVSGDAGNARSFDYPVRYQVIKGGFSDLIEGSPEILQSIIDGCNELKSLGIRGILGDCGLMSLYQDTIGDRCKIPFVGSALCQIPTVWQMLGCNGSIGILTGHAELLSEKHLRSSGWRDDIKLSVHGLQEEPHFTEIVINGGLNLNIDEMRQNVLHAGRELQEKTSDLRAIIIECSNLATFSKDLAEELNLPVFDTISAANLLQYSLNPPKYINS